MEYPQKGIIISRPLEGKVEVPILIFEAVLRLPMIDFFNEIVHKYDFSVKHLTPNAINKIVGFEMACRDLGVILPMWSFKYFFNSSSQSRVHMFSQWRGVHTFIIN